MMQNVVEKLYVLGECLKSLVNGKRLRPECTRVLYEGML